MEKYSKNELILFKIKDLNDDVKFSLKKINNSQKVIDEEMQYMQYCVDEINNLFFELSNSLKGS